MRHPAVSVIIPVYNEAQSLRLLHEKISHVLARIPHEILFVDDGSTDGSATIIKSIAAKDGTVRVFTFNRNRGKSAALDVGFRNAAGDAIIMLDADFQDDPADIPKFIEALRHYDFVNGWKVNRKDPLSKTIPSKFFNFITRILTGSRLHDINCGFKAMNLEVAHSITIYGELHRYIPVIVAMQGYSVGEVPVNHSARKFGTSKFGNSRLFRGFFDLLTIKFLMDFGNRPMHFFGSLGLFFAGLGTVLGSYLTYEWFQGVPIGNRPLMFLAVLMVILGIQFISIGFLGELILRTNQRR